MLQENESHPPTQRRNKVLTVGGLVLREQEGLLTRRVMVLNHFLLSASPPTSDSSFRHSEVGAVIGETKLLLDPSKAVEPISPHCWILRGSGKGLLCLLLFL